MDHSIRLDMMFLFWKNIELFGIYLQTNHFEFDYLIVFWILMLISMEYPLKKPKSSSSFLTLLM